MACLIQHLPVPITQERKVFSKTQLHSKLRFPSIWTDPLFIVLPILRVLTMHTKKLRIRNATYFWASGCDPTAAWLWLMNQINVLYREWCKKVERKEAKQGTVWTYGGLANERTLKPRWQRWRGKIVAWDPEEVVASPKSMLLICDFRTCYESRLYICP